MFSQVAALATTAPTVAPGSGVYPQVQSTVTIAGDAGNQIYFTTDGSNPSNLSTPYTVPVAIGNTAVIKAIAYASGVPSSITTSRIQSDITTLPVPRNGLKLWLKADFGPVLSGSNITQWSDLSSSSPANDATQGTAANQATLVNPSINGFPGGSFNGSSRRYALANQFADFTGGFSIFAVIKPVGTATKTLFASGNAGPANLISLETVNTQVRLTAMNASTTSNVITATGALTVGKYQLVDAVHTGTGTASISVNGSNLISGSVQNLLNVARTSNFVGSDIGQTVFWNGELAELLIYNRGLSETERKDLQAYLFTRYQIANATVAAAPIFSIGTSTLTEPQEVVIAGPSNATYFYTLDGTTPVAGSSPTYVSPIRINFTQTLKALAVANGITSNVTTATYTLNSTQWPAPSATDTRPLILNLQLPTTAIPQ